MAIIPDHLNNFTKVNPEIFLTNEDRTLLKIVTLYHLTLVEQFFLDHINPSLNWERLANASSPNLGATGVIRSKEFREKVSLAHIGRTYDKITKDLHRSNMLGVTWSDKRRAKMSISKRGVITFVKDIITSEVIVFQTKSSASIALH